MRPEKGSLMVLKRKSESGSESATFRVAGSPLFAVGAAFTELALDRGRHVVDDEVEHLIGADVAQARSEEHRENFVFANGIVQAGDDVLLGDGALVEELFHQRVIALGYQLDQSLVRGLGLLGHVVRDRADLGLAVAAHLVGVGLHLHQVDDPSEALFGADGQLHRNHGSPESRGERFHHPIEVGALAIHAGTNNGAGQSELVAVVPDALSDDLDSGNRVDHHERGFDSGQRHLGFMDEHTEAGGVDEVDLGFAPLHHRGGGGNRHGPRDFFLVVIGGGVAFVDPAQTLGGAGGEQQGRGEGSFTRV